MVLMITKKVCLVYLKRSSRVKIFNRILNLKLFFIITVGTGVLITVISAIITNHLLERNNLIIFSINKESAVIERRIEYR